MGENIWSHCIWLRGFRAKALESDQGEVGLCDPGEGCSLYCLILYFLICKMRLVIANFMDLL